MMKRILEVNLGAMILLTFAVGCGGNSSDSGGGGASSSAGNPGTPNAGAANGGAPTSSGGASGGAAHASGGQSNPGGGGFSTSVPGSTPLKDLTPDQLMQLCSDAQKYSDAVIGPVTSDLLCKVQALAAAAQEMTDAEAQSACKGGLAACTPDVTSDPGMCNGATAETCTATVADLALCANDTQAAITTFVATIPSCDAITPEKAQAALAAFAAGEGGGFMEPASCTKYDTECPGSMSGM